MDLVTIFLFSINKNNNLIKKNIFNKKKYFLCIQNKFYCITAFFCNSNHVKYKFLISECKYIKHCTNNILSLLCIIYLIVKLPSKCVQFKKKNPNRAHLTIELSPEAL